MFRLGPPRRRVTPRDRWQAELFTFKAPTELHWECNAAEKAAEILDSNGWNRVAIVADEGVLRSGVADQLLNELGAAEQQIFELDKSEPDIDFLDSVADEFRSLDPSVILGLGGGSAMDVAKGLSALQTNPGSAEDSISTLNFSSGVTLTLSGLGSQGSNW